jgi:hypothetical protein
VADNPVRVAKAADVLREMATDLLATAIAHHVTETRTAAHSVQNDRLPKSKLGS